MPLEMQLVLGGAGPLSWHVFGWGIEEYEVRLVGQILPFLAIFPLYARLISNVWFVC